MIRPAETAVAAPVMEVFASIQGEGMYVGEPQVFLRLRGCPLRCRYCDTPGSWDVAPAGHAPPARIAASTGARREPAWSTPFAAACWVREVEGRSPRTVSLTGGEPLVWLEFVRELRPLLGDRRMHLETAGAHTQALLEIVPLVDHVSLDLKAPGDLDAPVDAGLPNDEETWRAARREALRSVAGRDACAKIVVTAEGSFDAYEELLEEVWEHAPELPVVLQPATAIGAVHAPGSAALHALTERALELELDARVVPQLHRVLGLP